jgi:hypothetical protein
MERIVHRQLYDYLSNENILNDAQSGFRPKHSCQSSLHRLTEYIHKSLHEGKVVGMVAIDLKKAFDTVDHAILLEKLQFYGVRQNNLHWFESYLSDRRQFAEVNGSKSTPESVLTGVPQGSILGPLLFIIYTNDLPHCVNESQINMYADDTAIYFAHKSVKTINAVLNDDLNRVFEWFCANKVSMHFGKSVTMLISNPQKRRHLSNNVNVTTNGNNLENVSQLTYLGVLIDENLTFNDHITNVAKKVSRSIGIMKYCKFLPKRVLIHMYNAFVLPHIDYCCTVFYPLSQTNVTRLQRLQNRALRLLLKAPPRTHIEDMLSELNFMSIKQRQLFNLLVFTWKIVNNHLPSYLCDFNFVANVHQHFTRSSQANTVFIPRCSKRSLQFNAFTQWNILPAELRNAQSLPVFKRECSRYVFTHCTRF